MLILAQEDKKVIVFDIDGTLADGEHRMHLIRADGKKDWNTFFAKAVEDPPHYEIQWLNHIMADRDDVELVVLTARPEKRRDITERWLAEHGIEHTELILKTDREEQDRVPDYQFKERILDELIAQGRKPYMVFEDRQNVVDMWRKRGIKCLQVQPGDF